MSFGGFFGGPSWSPSSRITGGGFGARGILNYLAPSLALLEDSIQQIHGIGLPSSPTVPFPGASAEESDLLPNEELANRSPLVLPESGIDPLAPPVSSSGKKSKTKPAAPKSGAKSPEKSSSKKAAGGRSSASKNIDLSKLESRSTRELSGAIVERAKRNPFRRDYARVAMQEEIDDRRRRKTISSTGKAVAKGVGNGVEVVKKSVHKQAGNLLAAANDFRKAHPNAHDNIQNVGQFLSTAGVVADGVQIAAAAGVGATAGATAGAASGPGAVVGAAVGALGGAAIAGAEIAAKRYLTGKAMELGEKGFANFAARYAVGDGQKAEFKKTADLIYSAAVAGAAAVGMAKGALRGPKPKAPGAPKAAKPLVAVREAELAGTGMRVKVPVEEVPPGTTQAFAARKGDGKGSTNKAPKAKPVEKFAAEAAKNRVMRAYGEGKFWNTLKDVNHPDIRRKLGKINKQAFSGGQIRSNGTFIYKFDKAHQTSKVHLEVYKKTTEGWKPYMEYDPEIGKKIPGSEAKLKDKPAVRW